MVAHPLANVWRSPPSGRDLLFRWGFGHASNFYDPWYAGIFRVTHWVYSIALCLILMGPVLGGVIDFYAKEKQPDDDESGWRLICRCLAVPTLLVAAFVLLLIATLQP